MHKAESGGGFAARNRVYPCAVAFPRVITNQLNWEENAHMLLAAMRLDKDEQFPYERFDLPDSVIDTLCAPLAYGADRPPPKKKPKELEKWPMTHESLCSFLGFPWPPPASHLEKVGLRRREAEVVWIADKVYPEKKVGI